MSSNFSGSQSRQDENKSIEDMSALGIDCRSLPSVGYRALNFLESLARNKNEENAEASINQQGHRKHHQSSFGQELPNVGLSDA